VRIWLLRDPGVIRNPRPGIVAARIATRAGKIALRLVLPWVRGKCSCRNPGAAGAALTIRAGEIALGFRSDELDMQKLDVRAVGCI